MIKQILITQVFIMPDIPESLELIVVFLWSFADSAFPISLFIPGEPVFLYVGYQLAGHSSFGLLLAALLGGFASDQVSYWIGIRYGQTVLKRLKSRKKRRQVARMRWALKRYGARFVILARFLGPVAWVTPVLCGSVRLPYMRFWPATLIGCLMGIGQFIVVGYLSRKGFELMNLQAIISFSLGSFCLILATINLLFAIFVLHRFQNQSGIMKRI